MEKKALVFLLNLFACLQMAVAQGMWGNLDEDAKKVELELKKAIVVISGPASNLCSRTEHNREMPQQRSADFGVENIKNVTRKETEGIIFYIGEVENTRVETGYIKNSGGFWAHQAANNNQGALLWSVRLYQPQLIFNMLKLAHEKQQA